MLNNSVYEVSYKQNFMCKNGAKGSANLDYVCWEVDKAVSEQNVKIAVDTVINANEALRIQYMLRNEQLVQSVDQKKNADLKVFQSKTDLEEYISKKVLSLQNEFYPSFYLFKEKDKTYLCLIFDEMFLDHYSIKLISNQLDVTLNKAEIDEKENDFIDFVLWENDIIREIDFLPYETYWSKELAGNLSSVFKQKDSSLPQSQQIFFESFAPSFSSTAEKMASSLGIDVSDFYLILLSIVLGEQFGIKELFIGRDYNKRTTPEISKIIGELSNTNYTRFFINKDLTFSEMANAYLKKKKKSVLYMNLPFERMIDALKKQTENVDMLSDVFYSYHEDVSYIHFKYSRVELQLKDFTKRYKLNVQFNKEVTGNVALKIYYNSMFFSEADISTLKKDMQILLSELKKNITESVEFSLLNKNSSTEDKKKRISDLNDIEKYHKKTKPIDFGVLFFSSNSPKQSKNGRYDLILDAVKFADTHGFCSVWTPERHFNEFGGLFPNPSVLSAALAMITKNIQLRSASVVPSLHNILRIAEEWSIVDNVSKGRIGLSLASGWHENDFVLKPENYLERRNINFDSLKTLQSLWAGNSIKRKNGLGDVIDIKTYPQPFQEKLPIWITTGNKDVFIKAAKVGANILTSLMFSDVEQLKKSILAYRLALVQAGYKIDQGKVVVMLQTFVGENNNETIEIARRPFINYLRQSTGLFTSLLRAAYINIDINDIDEETMNGILNNTFERYVQNASLIGSIEKCSTFIEKLRDAGVDEVACLIDFGIESELILKHLPNLNQLKNKFEYVKS